MNGKLDILFTLVGLLVLGVGYLLVAVIRLDRKMTRIDEWIRWFEKGEVTNVRQTDG